MKSDVLSRVREALRIEDAPAGGALVPAKSSPPAKLADKAKANQVVNAALAAASYRPPQPQPQNVTRRVEIMVTGAVVGHAVVGLVRDTLTELRVTLAELQAHLSCQAGETG